MDIYPRRYITEVTGPLGVNGAGRNVRLFDLLGLSVDDLSAKPGPIGSELSTQPQRPEYHPPRTCHQVRGSLGLLEDLPACLIHRGPDGLFFLLQCLRRPSVASKTALVRLM